MCYSLNRDPWAQLGAEGSRGSSCHFGIRSPPTTDHNGVVQGEAKGRG